MPINAELVDARRGQARLKRSPATNWDGQWLLVNGSHHSAPKTDDAACGTVVSAGQRRLVSAGAKTSWVANTCNATLAVAGRACFPPICSQKKKIHAQRGCRRMRGRVSCRASHFRIPLSLPSRRWDRGLRTTFQGTGIDARLPFWTLTKCSSDELERKRRARSGGHRRYGQHRRSDITSMLQEEDDRGGRGRIFLFRARSTPSSYEKKRAVSDLWLVILIPMCRSGTAATLVQAQNLPASMANMGDCSVPGSTVRAI